MDKIVGFCDQYIRIRYQHPAAAALVDFLCADLECVPNSDVPGQQPVLPRAVCELKVTEDGQFLLQRNGEQLYQGRCQRESAYSLINEIIFQCLNDNNTGLALHAGAVQVGNQGILLPGNSGSGKSTFAAWLTACGCRYLSDELIVLSEDGTRIRPFTRPLTIRSASAQALAPYVRFQENEVLSGDSGFMVPHRLLNPDFTPAQPPPALILFPCYRADASARLTELTPGLGCSRLMECYVNARNIPGHGISDLARISRSVPLMELKYGNFTGLGTLLAEALPEFFRNIFS